MVRQDNISIGQTKEAHSSSTTPDALTLLLTDWPPRDTPYHFNLVEWSKAHFAELRFQTDAGSMTSQSNELTS